MHIARQHKKGVLKMAGMDYSMYKYYYYLSRTMITIYSAEQNASGISHSHQEFVATSSITYMRLSELQCNLINQNPQL